MAPYHYNNYYDPVGSQSSQPQSYTYQGATSQPSTYPSSSTLQNYNTSNYPNYGSNSYNTQAHANSTQSSLTDNNHAAAAALSSLGGQDYGQHNPGSRSANSTNQYGSSTWSGLNNYGPDGFTAAKGHMSNRSQSNKSPSYPSGSNNSSATFGRTNYSPPEMQGQSTYQSSNHHGTSTTSGSSHPQYQTAYNTQNAHTQQSQPQRYASPLHAVQARNHNNRASPQTSQSNVQHGRQQSASVEPTAMTVNPSQVYDNRAELERKAAMEAERRRKREAAEAARKVEEERREAERKAEEDRVAHERAADEAMQEAREFERATAVKKAVNATKAANVKRKREENKMSKNAASVLQSLASGGNDLAVDEAPASTPEEAEMRAMFRKMREFNQRNPAMLAKLWEEERKAHAGSNSPQTARATPAASHAQQRPGDAIGAVNASASDTPQLKPFQAPPQHPAPVRTALPAQPVIKPAAQSFWLPGKKDHLAEGAVNWLMAQPGNAGKTILKQDMRRHLDNSISYVDLCESLESLGLEFQRATFARLLLKAIPEGLRAQTSSKLPTPLPNSPLGSVNNTAPMVNESTQQPLQEGNRRGMAREDDTPAQRKDNSSKQKSSADLPMSQFSSLDDLAHGSNTMDRRLSYPIPLDTYPGGTYSQQPTSYFPPRSVAVQSPPTSTLMSAARGSTQPMTTLETKPDVKAASPPRPPADKEEAARKRTFGDLVDLSNEGSDDDETTPRTKMMQGPSGLPAPPPSENMSNTKGQSNPPPDLNVQQYRYQDNLRDPMANEDGMHPPAPIVPSHQKRTPNQLATPHLTLTKQATSQTTPIVQTLNVKPKGPSEEQKQQDRIRGKMLVEPIMRDRVARKSAYDSRTIARDVLLATGRHPDMRGLNGHLNPMQKLLGDRGGSVDTGDMTKGNRADLSTIRWDIIDPELSQRDNGDQSANLQSRTHAETSAFAANNGADKHNETDAWEDSRQPHRARVSSEAGSKIGVHKKNGRPRKDKGKLSAADELAAANATAAYFAGAGPSRQHTFVSESRSQAVPVNTSAPSLARQPTPKTKKATTPSTFDRTDGTPMSGPVGYAALRQVDEQGNVVKKKGRPVGWRKSLHSREAHGFTSSKGSAKQKPLDSPAQQLLQEPRYQIYPCHWENCGSQLHNLDTLKKHIVKMHARRNSVALYHCHWNGCKDHAFAYLEDWLKHIDGEHLQPIAWKLGDGPKGGMTVTKYSSNDLAEAPYLSDTSGRSVTPFIVPRSDQGTAAHALPVSLHDATLSQDSADDLKGLVQHKRIVGPSLDRTGCRLANTKRRMGFLDDEDFEDEILESDDEDKVR